MIPHYNNSSKIPSLRSGQRRWRGWLALALAMLGVLWPAHAQIDVVALATDGFVGWESVAANAGGEIAFIGVKKAGEDRIRGVYRSSGTGHSKVVEEGGTFQGISAVDINNQGKIAFAANAELTVDGTPIAGNWIVLAPQQPLELIGYLPGNPVVSLAFNDGRQLAYQLNLGQAYVTAQLLDGPFGRGGIQLGSQSGVSSVVMNNAGYVGFLASQPNGLQSVLRSAPLDWTLTPDGNCDCPEPETQVLASGFFAILQPATSESGSIAFLGQKAGDDFIGLYSASGGTAQLIAKLAPDDPSRFIEISTVSLSPQGTPFVSGARMKEGSQQVERGIFRWNAGTGFTKVIGEGAHMFHQGKLWRVFPGALWPKSVSNSGRVAFYGGIVTLDGTESRTGIFTTLGAPDPPEEPTTGTVYHWKGPSATNPSGLFGAASNWDPEGVPTKNGEQADTAFFSLSSSYSVGGNSAKAERMIVAAGTLDLSVGTYAVASTSEAEPSVTVNGGAKLNLTGGLLRSVHTTLGSAAGGLAEAHVFNSGTVWSNQGRLSVGRSGPGYLFVANGAELRTADLLIADGADGSAVVGGGGNLSFVGSGPGLAVAVGYQNGSGTLEVEAGGQVFLRELSVGQSLSSTGLVIVTGVTAGDATPSRIIKFGQYGVGHVTIGELGDGELRVEDGGVFEIQGDSPMKVGAISATGRVFVRGTNPSGAASTLAFSLPSPGGSHLFLGDQDGHGEFTVESGGRVFTEDTGVQVGASGTGIVRILGVGGAAATNLSYSSWKATSFVIGSAGNGLVEVKGGGILTTESLEIGKEAGSTGLLVIEGTAGETNAWSEVQSELMFVGAEAGSTGEVQVLSGGTLKLAGWLQIVGQSGKGRLLVSGFDSATSDRSTTEFPEILVLGLAGKGELVVTNGALVEGHSVWVNTVDTALFAANPNIGTGTVTVTGTGGGEPSELYLSSQLLIGGQTGTAWVEVSNGGVIVVGDAEPLANTLRVGTNGFLGGTGTIYGNLEILGGSNAFTGGVVSAGSSPGTLTIQGNLTQHSNSVIVIEVRGTTAGTQHDQIVVTGTADLRGTILLVFQNGYAPRTGHQLRLFDLPSGAPATLPAVQIQNLAPGFNYSLATSAGKLTLTASNNATFVPPATTVHMDAIRVVNGVAELRVQSNLDFGAFGVQATSDLRSWADIGQVRIVRGTGRFMDVNAPRFSRLFYRIKTTP